MCHCVNAHNEIGGKEWARGEGGVGVGVWNAEVTVAHFFFQGAVLSSRHCRSRSVAGSAESEAGGGLHTNAPEASGSATCKVPLTKRPRRPTPA